MERVSEYACMRVYELHLFTVFFIQTSVEHWNNKSKSACDSQSIELIVVTVSSDNFRTDDDQLLAARFEVSLCVWSLSQH